MTTETISIQELKEAITDKRQVYQDRLDELISDPEYTDDNYKEGMTLVEKMDELRWVLTLIKE